MDAINENPLGRVYRKTAEGQSEIRNRAAGISAAARAVLIVINGQLPLSHLRNTFGPAVLEQIHLLLDRRLIEVSSAVAAPPEQNATTSPSSVMPAPVTEVIREEATRKVIDPDPPAPPRPDEVARLRVLKREAYGRLISCFGPDVDVVLKPLLNARTAQEYVEALTGIESKVALYRGRRGAKELLQDLQP